MHLRYTLLLAALFAPVVAAQTSGSCQLGQATAELSLSDVRARLDNTGGLFWRGGNPVYEVPKGGGVSALFAAGLWLGGTVDGEVRTAAARYADWEFWPGPLDEGATLPNPDDCSAYDRIYRVSTPELAAYEAGNPPTPALAAWPVGLGAPAVDAGGAPVVPTSRDQTLDLEAGERPVIFGTETAFWVMNDVGNDHLTTGSLPLGVEVRVSAFSINDPDEAVLDQATLYRYEILNRNTSTIEGFRAGIFADQDLGDGSDDYLGSDASRGMLYVYNADDDDDGGGYGVAPPALGIDVLSDPGNAMVWIKNDGPIAGEPQTAADYYQYLSSRWKNDEPVTRLGYGYNPGESTDVTLWSYDGDAALASFWSANDALPASGAQPRPAGDVRSSISAAPVTLAPGAVHIVDVGIVFARGTDHLDSITELRAASDLVQSRYDDGSLFDATSGDLGLPPLAAPALLSPDDGTVFTVPETVVLDWEPVVDTEAYRIEYADSETFLDARRQTVTAPPVQVAFSDLPTGNADPVYWRITAMNEAGLGPASEMRSFIYAYTFEPGVTTLADGQPAFLEVAGPGGADPCGPNAASTFGCAEAGGNAVFGGDDLDGGDTPNPNGTGQYTLFSRGNVDFALTSVAPREIEIRFTADGSIATHLFTEADGETHRVPFELWDIGIVPLGAGGEPAENDVADDVRLIPVLFSDDAGNGVGACAFEFGEVPASESASGFALTDRIYAFTPETTYADFEAAAAPLVDTATDGCYLDVDRTLAAFVGGERTLERIVVADLIGSGTVADLDGAVIRFHTTDPQPVSDEAAPTAEALALTVVPNPSRGAARVRFSMAVSGTARVRILDVLGREVAVVAEGERRAGAHEVTLPNGLASGVYVVAVEASGERTARTFTVVR